MADLDPRVAVLEAALEAIERLIAWIGPRFDAIEGRITGQQRLSSVEASVDAVARRIEQSIADSNFRIEQMLSDISARLP